MTPQNPSPMTEGVRTHERVPADPNLAGEPLSGLLDRPAWLFASPPFGTGEGIDLLVHFHGPAHVPASVADSLTAVVVVNLGSGSAAYERPFRDDPGLFLRLLDSVRVVTGIRQRRVFVSSWSAGYGAVRAILEQVPDRLDGLLLLDGLHTDHVPTGVPLADGSSLNTDRLEVFRVFSGQAALGRRAMIVTHSEVFPGTYASTTETATWLANALGLDLEPVLAWGPVGMQQISAAERGRLSVRGYAGNSAPDHVDHLHALPRLCEDLLKL